MKTTKQLPVTVRTLTAALATLLLSFGVQAQEQPGFNDNQWYVSGGAAFYGGPDGSAADDGTGPALAVGYGLSDDWAIELLFADFDTDAEPGLSVDGSLNLLWVDVLRSMHNGANWQPYWIAGAGVTEEIRQRDLKDLNDTQVSAGAGVFRRLSDRFSLRGEVRANYSFEYSDVQPAAFLGLSIKLGKLNTAPPRPLAPPTPADSDDDGVADNVDQCPRTAPGVRVDARGCEVELDQDGDGVVDANDRCPNTARKVAVDSRGCALDSDGDGVNDGADDCPNSRAGAKVDERGCYVVLIEDIGTELDIEFDTNSSVILSKHEPEILRAIEFVRQHPTASVVIEGHTDNTGAAAYNQGLSESRAASVLDYMRTRTNIDTGRITSAGFGETRPIADNSTAAGRQTNRRVAVVIKATRETTQ